jgi:CubicO group peptidase (beta-lactamase class C family)
MRFCLLVVVLFAVAARLGMASTAAVYDGVTPGAFMTRWAVLGPIPVFEGEPHPDDAEREKRAFDTDYLSPDTQPEIGAEHDIAGVLYQWRLVESAGDIVVLSPALGSRDGDIEHVSAYAAAELNVPEETTLLLGIGSDDGIKVWVNGELAHENWVGRPLTVDEDTVPVALRKGVNTLLLKIQNGTLDWSFACRALDGAAIADSLIAAARRGDLDSLKMLLTNGANIDATVGRGMNALHAAKIAGRTEAVGLLIANGADENAPLPNPASLVDVLFDRLIEGESPGVSVLVSRGGSIVYQKGFGYADIENGTRIAPTTKLRIGSNTKQFTAASILKLQEEGRLSVSDPLSKYFLDFPRGDEVTVHHLLTHTSGIHSYTSVADFIEKVPEPIAPEDLVLQIQKYAYDFDPGEQFLYNNSGFFLLGEIVAQISGQSFEDYLRTTFFGPLGMADTGVHRSDLDLASEALGYSYTSGATELAVDWDMSWTGGAGALYSTVLDLHRWNEAVFGGEALSAESLEAALTPVALNNGSVPVWWRNGIVSGGYGYGWALSDFRGVSQIAHGGGLHGFLSQLARFPDNDMTVIVLGNSSPPTPGVSPASLALAVAEIYLWEEMDARESIAVNADTDAAVYSDYVGRYQYPQGAVMTVTLEGDSLFAQLPGEPQFEIFPKSDTEFFWKAVDAQVTFVRDEQGAVSHAVHKQGGREFEATVMPDEIVATDVDPAVYDDYAGDYDYNAGAILTVRVRDGRLFAQMTGQPENEIFPRSQTEFFWKVVAATMTFVRDESGEVVKARLEQGGGSLDAPKVR